MMSTGKGLVTAYPGCNIRVTIMSIWFRFYLTTDIIKTERIVACLLSASDSLIVYSLPTYFYVAY
ncbi:hypothetical protein P280DRAFT_471907 [Massarina eburnea CBS 473.64]|uniref:Uncharacterized protein n=1 Tax=Massarina eburnea CBS 473.64 TaxID=1395130 RepID=A0A6A6RU10_9PLEO|nr:hypothetical protein P280DRAFT_471907 [Massarina eburnea CBS 473.64]